MSKEQLRKSTRRFINIVNPCIIKYTSFKKPLRSWHFHPYSWHLESMDVTDRIADATVLEFIYSRTARGLQTKEKENPARVHYSHVKLSVSHLVRVTGYRAVLESNFHSNRNVRSQILHGEKWKAFFTVQSAAIMSEGNSEKNCTLKKH